MTPVGPLRQKRLPESVRRQTEVASATAWEALVEAHTAHALRFITLLAARVPFDTGLDRYLTEMDVRDPMAASVRSRVLIALENAAKPSDERPSLPYEGEEGDGAEGLRRFRPDVLMKGITRKVRESGEMEELVQLAIARAEEGVIRAHIDNAVLFAGLLRGYSGLDEAVEDYIEEMRISGGRAQAVYQRTMARLADVHLPADDGDAAASGGTEEPDARG